MMLDSIERQRECQLKNSLNEFLLTPPPLLALMAA
jgi:hypothetical protein